MNNLDKSVATLTKRLQHLEARVVVGRQMGRELSYDVEEIRALSDALESLTGNKSYQQAVNCVQDLLEAVALADEERYEEANTFIVSVVKDLNEVAKLQDFDLSDREIKYMVYLKTLLTKAQLEQNRSI